MYSRLGWWLVCCVASRVLLWEVMLNVLGTSSAFIEILFTGQRGEKKRFLYCRFDRMGGRIQHLNLSYTCFPKFRVYSLWAFSHWSRELEKVNTKIKY